MAFTINSSIRADLVIKKRELTHETAVALE